VALLLIAVALLVAGCHEPTQGAQDVVVRGPYLQQTGMTSTYVVWQTSRPLAGAIHWGEESTDEHVELAPDALTMQAVQLRGLSPGTSYVYRVSAGDETTRPFRFTTAKQGAVPFTFGAIGDFGTGSTPEYRNAALLEGEAPDTLLTLGDNAYPLGLKREYPAVVFTPFDPLMRRITVWPTLGNHDYGNEGESFRNTAQAYLDTFVLPDRPGRERYYSFRYANAEFLAIDSEVTSFAPGSPQYRWIDRTLGRSGACWKIPYFHHPVHAEYVHPTLMDVAKQADLQRWLVPVFERHGVKLVLTGHEHNYVRTKRLLHGRPDPQGVVYIISGGGGGALEALPAHATPSTAVRGRFFHHLLISVAGRRAEVRAVDTAGRVRDRVRLAC
jgi:hypothetical protein